MAAGGTFTAADGTTHVQVCTSPDGKTWQATDLGPGGNQPHGGPHPAMALGPDGRAVALWGSTVGCPAACSYILQASVRPPGGSWGAPVTLSTELNWGAGGLMLGMDGSGDAIAAWVGFYADASHYAVLPAGGGSWGPAQTLSTYVQGDARNLSLAVSPNGSAIVAYATQHDAIWAVSGTVLGGFSAPVFVAAGDYGKNSAPKAALDDAGNASLVWSQTTGTQAATRSPGGTWSAAAVLATQSSSSVATAIDGAGNAIAVFGSSYSWHLAGGSWRPAARTAGRIVRRAGRRRSRRHLRLRRQRRQRVHVRGRRHQLRHRQRIARQPGRPEDRPRPGRDARRQRRIQPRP